MILKITVYEQSSCHALNIFKLDMFHCTKLKKKNNIIMNEDYRFRNGFDETPLPQNYELRSWRFLSGEC